MSKNNSKKINVVKRTDSFLYIDLFKKLALALFLVFLLFVLFKGVTGNAIYSNFGSQLDNAIYQIQPIFQFFLGGENYDGQLLFERFLFFLIILSFVFVALKGTPLFTGGSNKNILTVLSIVVSILSVSYINYDWLRTSVMSYTILGIAITSFLPFVIYFFFLNGVARDHASVRKIGWILFMVIYFGLWITAEEQIYESAYLWTGLAALAFFMFDGTIYRYLKMQEIKGMGKNSIEEAEIELRRRMHQLRVDLSNGIITQGHFDNKIKDYEKRLASLHR